jgi:hypothetical protein
MLADPTPEHGQQNNNTLLTKQPEATDEYEESWNMETNDLVRVRVPSVAARRLAIELHQL